MTRLFFLFQFLFATVFSMSFESADYLESIENAVQYQEDIYEAEQRRLEEIEMMKRNILILAIADVESAQNPLAYNPSEDAVGYLQIRQIMIKEINRLVEYKRYDYEDRWIKEKSIQAFIDYQNAVNPEWDFEVAARRWNGGHYGDLKSSTVEYWYKVKAAYNKRIDQNSVLNDYLI